MWMLYAAGSAVFAALVAIFGKIGLQGINPTLATTIRAVFMALMLVGIGIFSGIFKSFSPASFDTKAWTFIMLSAAAGAASWLCYFIALRAGPAGAVAVIDKLSVVLVILLAAALFGEALTARSVLGIVLTVAGTLLIIFK